MIKQNVAWHELIPNPISGKADNFMSWELGEIHCTSDKIRNVLDAESQEQVVNIQNQLSELVTELRLEVDRISNELGYSYREADYINRIYFNSKLISEQRNYLFHKYPNLNRLFNEILYIFPDSLKQSMIDYINKLYIEDLIYESYISKKYSAILPDWKNFKKLKDIYSLIDNLHENDKNYLKLEHEDLFKILWNKTGLLFDLMKYAWMKWIKILHLWQTNLVEIFSNNPKWFIEFIGTIWSSWIKNLDLWMNHLEKIFWNWENDFMEFIRTAWLSWIRVLNITGTRLNIIYKTNSTDFVSLMRIAWESGIKNLWLWLCFVGDIFIDHPEDLIDMVDVAWKSWIRNLRLNSCWFTDTFQGHIQLLRDFLKACEESEVKVINLGNNHLYKYDEHIKGIDKIIEKLMKWK